MSQPHASRGSPGVRRAAVAVIAAASIATAARSFWQFDLRYALPTPVPSHLHRLPLGAAVAAPPAVARHLHADRPALLHFYNAECPCSRFNLDHLRALVRDFSARVDIVAVVEGDDAAVVDDFLAVGLGIPCVFDAGGAVAALCGVYSTPQAVVLAPGGRLFYRGNYNHKRFCAERHTEFARIALEALLAGRGLPLLPAAATTAYGCELPSNRIAGGR